MEALPDDGPLQYKSVPVRLASGRSYSSHGFCPAFPYNGNCEAGTAIADGLFFSLRIFSLGHKSAPFSLTSCYLHTPTVLPDASPPRP